jgi:hypothetical protein
MAALRKGVQRALFQLGRVPRFHQIRLLDGGDAPDPRGPGGAHRGQPAAVQHRVRGADAALRDDAADHRAGREGAERRRRGGQWRDQRRLEQALLARGSRDFESVEAWQAFVDETLRKANANRGRRVAEELAAMRELDVAKLPEYVAALAQLEDAATWAPEPAPITNALAAVREALTALD